MTKLKVVVRRLPPNLPEPIFWNSVAQWVSSESITWKSFHPGKPRSRPEKPNVSSRAYIVFKTIEQVSRFSREYDGHIFRDKQGNESFAIVEFAPFQKVPQERKKQDSRMATIQQDDDFKSFLESLNAAPSSVSEPGVPTIDPKATPLLEALKAEKAAAKDAAQILSYHGHYHKAAKADRAAAKAASKAPKAATAGDIVKEDEAVVFSRKLNPDGTPAIVPKTILTKSAGSSKAPGKNRGNGTEASAQASSKQSEKAKKKSLQGQAQSQGKGPAASATGTTSVTILPHASPKPTPASKSTVAELAEAATSQGASSARPERKRHVANPRMFEAALASVGGSPGVRRREKEAKKEKGDVTGGETSQVGATNAPASTPSSAAAHTSKSAEPTSASASTSDKKDRQPNPPTRGGAHGVGKNPKRDRGSKPSGPSTSETGAGNGSVAAAPKILIQDISDANAQPVATSAHGTADIKDVGSPGAPASRGSHSGRRGRGRGRGRGGASSGGAGPNTSSTDS